MLRRTIQYIHTHIEQVTSAVILWACMQKEADRRFRQFTGYPN